MSRGHIHDLLLVKPGQRLRDDEGRWTLVGDPVPFRGRISFRSASRAEVAAGRGEVAMTVVQCPHDLAPDKGHVVLAEDLTGRDVLLNGAWMVDAVVSTPAHARLMCSRTETP